MVRALVLSAHPIPTVGVTLLAIALGFAVDIAPGRVALLGAAVLAGQVSIGWSNDAIDAGRDARAGRDDKPIARGAIARTTVARAALVALVATIGLSLAVGVLAGSLHLLFVACGWAYNVVLKHTVLSWLPYAIGFAALPSSVVLVGDPSGVPWWLPGAGGLLGVAAHVVNVLPDVADDLATGVHGWPHRLGRPRAVALATAALVGASLLLTLAPPGAPTGWQVAGLALAVGLAVIVTGVGLRAGPAVRWLLPAVIGIALVDVLLLVAGSARAG